MKPAGLFWAFRGCLGTGGTVSELLDLPEDLLEGLLTIARGLAG